MRRERRKRWRNVVKSVLFARLFLPHARLPAPQGPLVRTDGVKVARSARLCRDSESAGPQPRIRGVCPRTCRLSWDWCVCFLLFHSSTDSDWSGNTMFLLWLLMRRLALGLPTVLQLNHKVHPCVLQRPEELPVQPPHARTVPRPVGRPTPGNVTRCWECSRSGV